MNTLKRYILLRFNKAELNYFSSLLGLVTTICVTLSANGYGNSKFLNTVGSLSAGVLSILINAPATAHPNTEELEQSISEEQNN